MKKRIQVLTLAAGMTIIPMTAGAAQDDITGGWYEDDIRELAAKGIMQGDGNGIYAPNRVISRGEFAKLIAQALQLPESDATFVDLHEAHPTLIPGIQKAAGAGIIKGRGNGMFVPTDSVRREEVAMMIDRALQYKGVIGKSVATPFVDMHEAYDQEAVKRVYGLGIINGQEENGRMLFAPKANASRAEAAAMLNRMLRAIEGQKLIVQGDYVLYHNGTKGNGYATYTEAVEAAKRSNATAVKYKDTYMWVKEGVAFANLQGSPTINIYSNEAFSKDVTYIERGTELQIIDVKEQSVQVSLSGAVGYVKKSEVTIMPLAEAERSSYEVKNGEIIHRISNGNTYSSFVYGKAPSYLPSGTYYSKDDKTFNGHTYYNYFNFVSGRAKTVHTGADIDKYIQTLSPNSIMVGLGNKFKEVEAKYNVNALLLVSIAINESDYGNSSLAREKNNLFGLRAVDNDPFGQGEVFNSLEDCIEHAAKVYMDAGYLNAKHPYRYTGGYLGDKGGGMNVKYASDPYWGQKAASHMYRIDRSLGGKDLNRHKLALVKQDVRVTVNGSSYTVPKDRVVTVTKEDAASVTILADLQGGVEATVSKSALHMLAPN